MKKLMLLILTTLFITTGFAQEGESAENGSYLTKEQRQAKWEERYNNASDEKKARMDKKRERRQARRAEWKTLSKEEKQAKRSEMKAKWQEKYDSASPEKQAKMEKRKAKRKERRQQRRQRRQNNQNNS